LSVLVPVRQAAFPIPPGLGRPVLFLIMSPRATTNEHLVAFNAMIMEIRLDPLIARAGFFLTDFARVPLPMRQKMVSYNSANTLRASSEPEKF